MSRLDVDVGTLRHEVVRGVLQVVWYRRGAGGGGGYSVYKRVHTVISMAELWLSRNLVLFFFWGGGGAVNKSKHC